MLGRALRGRLTGGGDESTLKDVLDNVQSFGDAGDVYEVFDEYWRS
jgi:hypothetical protein